MKKPLQKIGPIAALFGALVVSGCATAPSRMDLADADLQAAEDMLKTGTIPTAKATQTLAAAVQESQSEPPQAIQQTPAQSTASKPGCSSAAGMMGAMFGSGCRINF